MVSGNSGYAIRTPDFGQLRLYPDAQLARNNRVWVDRWLGIRDRVEDVTGVNIAEARITNQSPVLDLQVTVRRAGDGIQFLIERAGKITSTNDRTGSR